MRARYVQAFAKDERSTTLRRLLDAGVAGSAREQQYLAVRDLHPESGMYSAKSDTGTTEYEAVREEGEYGVLHRAR